MSVEAQQSMSTCVVLCTSRWLQLSMQLVLYVSLCTDPSITLRVQLSIAQSVATRHNHPVHVRASIDVGWIADGSRDDLDPHPVRSERCAAGQKVDGSAEGGRRADTSPSLSSSILAVSSQTNDRGTSEDSRQSIVLPAPCTFRSHSPKKIRLTLARHPIPSSPRLPMPSLSRSSSQLLPLAQTPS